ncbi:stage II sporulation protein M [Pleomorphovibrio marinus]|uniref:stage II sporulation protein M n=1 Tax=Pleomorphovibrio marinus TaxID=2164132 RepID=UPI000E0C5B88|nr:stage II sporulation protein M [Pleomorphovibrio marinus]
MNLRTLTLSASLVYILGGLVGFHIDPGYDLAPQGDGAIFSPLGQTKSGLVWAIAVNNISVALINLFGGFSLGMVSALNTFYNGAVLGYTLSVAGDNMPLSLIASHLLPHSIEVVGIILSCSLGFYLGMSLFRRIILNREPGMEYRKFMFLAALSLAILVAAAFLEVFLSIFG